MWLSKHESAAPLNALTQWIHAVSSPVGKSPAIGGVALMAGEESEKPAAAAFL